jgi:hypothetical protein
MLNFTMSAETSKLSPPRTTLSPVKADYVILNESSPAKAKPRLGGTLFVGNNESPQTILTPVKMGEYEGYMPVATASKFERDCAILESQRLFEMELHKEIELSKAVLLRKTSETEDCYRQDLSLVKEYYRKLLIEKEAAWQKKYDDMENNFKDQIEAVKKKATEQIQGLHSRVTIETEAKGLANGARQKAREEDLKMEYEKKLKKFEKRVKEVVKIYENKEMASKGALDEVRRELSNAQAYVEAREQEMQLKIHEKVDVIIQLEKSIQELAQWKNAVLVLAKHTIDACATATAIPELGEKPTTKDKKLLTLYRFFNKYKADTHVIAQKASLALALQYSKVSYSIDDCCPALFSA